MKGDIDITFPVLQDKSAIVTGAAMGMGAATAQLSAEAGAKVVVADMNEEKGRGTVEAIEAAGGRSSPGQSSTSTPATPAAELTGVRARRRSRPS